MSPGKDRWAEIEVLYRLGQLSIREIARQFNVGASAIVKKAKKNGWMRDFAPEVRSRTRETLLGNTSGNAPTKEDIEKAVETGVSVIRTHRKDIAKARKIFNLLSDQLQHYLEGKPNGVHFTKGDTISSIFNAMTSSMTRFIALERQAFDLDEKSEELPSYKTVQGIPKIQESFHCSDEEK